MILNCVIRSNARYARDGIVKNGKIKAIQLDSSKSYLLYEIMFKDQSDIKTIREFIKTKENEEVADILHMVEDYIWKCHDIEPEKLQRLISPKVMNATQEEW